MQITKVKSLTYTDVLVGLRIYSKEGVFDVDKDALTNIGIYNINLKNRIPLIDYEDTLTTQEELDNSIKATDISEDQARLNELLQAISGTPASEILCNYQLPFEQTRKTFVEDNNWKTEIEYRNDEYNNQNNLYTPNGKRYRGGWIGKGRNPQKVKAIFHYEQCYWAFHKGYRLNSEVIEPYKDLQIYQKIVNCFRTQFTLRESPNHVSPLIEVKRADNTEAVFPLAEFPYQRLAQREFVTKHNIILPLPDGVELPKNAYLNEDPRELVIIALEQFIHTHMKKPFFFNQYDRYVFSN